MGINKTIDWIHAHSIPGEGIAVSTKQLISYPEVTGYLIPTLLACGERTLALEYSNWLTSVQNSDGSIPNPARTANYAFDTGQVLRGWVALLPDHPHLEYPIRNACSWLIRNSTANGRLPVPSAVSDWALGDRGFINEAVHLYSLPPILRAAQLLGESSYAKFVQTSLDYYLHNCNVTEFKQRNMLSHLYCYIQEALVELGAEDVAIKGMNSLALSQQENGAVPAYFDTEWICTPGQLQAAIVWYKLNYRDKAETALAFIENFKNPSGCFWGSYGFKADYFTAEEISWAAKFYLDASLLKIQKFFDAEHAIFPDEVAAHDGRLKAIVDFAHDLNFKSVLDVGCGKGRFSSALKNAFPHSEITGLDISDELLASVPSTIKTVNGSILNIPFADETFDFVFCVEALEHAVRVDAALAEMCRVLKTNGKLIIIDKNLEHWGRFRTPDWEQWFSPDKLLKEIQNYCQAEHSFIGYDTQLNPDGLFIAWKGIKTNLNKVDKNPELVSRDNSVPLNPDGWHDSLLKDVTVTDLAHKVRSGAVPEWLGPILQHSHPGEIVIELGSGTGELSAILARENRSVILIDFSLKNIAFSKELFKELGLSALFIHADVTKQFPLPSNFAHLVWSSGLLEHFEEPQIVHILKESARVSKCKVASLVPNALSLPYRIGKLFLENSNKWAWGKETPMLSMKELFTAASLTDIDECSIGAFHSLSFLADSGLNQTADAFNSLFSHLSPDDLNKLNQGYLLATIGNKTALKCLGVIPSDPLQAYEDAGYGSWLEEYYNPQHYFDKVYCLSPLETAERIAHGMHVIPTQPSELADRIRDLNISIVRAYGGFWPCDMATAGKVEGVPVVVSIHDSSPGMLHDSILKADRVLSISQAVKETLLKRGVSPDNILNFKNRVNFSTFARVPDQEKQIAFNNKYPGRYRILHVGRKSAEKNLDTLIKALGLLGAEYTGIFVGKGDETPYRLLTEKLGISDRCHFVQSVLSEELPIYYSFCDVMCTPSRHEGFGIVFIEALACESVVVTSNIKPMNEYIADGSNGILIDSFDDPEALASTIKKAATDSHLRSAIQKVARSSIQQFSKEIVDEQEVALYKQILDQRR